MTRPGARTMRESSERAPSTAVVGGREASVLAPVVDSHAASRPCDPSVFFAGRAGTLAPAARVMALVPDVDFDVEAQRRELAVGKRTRENLVQGHRSAQPTQRLRPEVED